MFSAKLIGRVLAILLVTLYVIYHIWFHLTIPFWSKMPIYHKNNIAQIITAQKHGMADRDPMDNIIEHRPQLRKRYYRPQHRFRTFRQLTEYDREHFWSLIHGEYLRGKGEEYLPTKEAVFNYLNAPHMDAYLSLNFIGGELRGAVTSRALDWWEGGDLLDAVQYVDFLCVRGADRGRVWRRS